ncbi:transposase [Peptococcaceae bacterium SCADC1_2_3]|jgi:REP element-mobilizing transposase RayT|nr:transposase [Peptococcaceae bacterium SCADC1_2_3]KFI35881.1 transposase [Peptococcaceae bacterium SCADC1_2_3]KFI36836.1 transposase [Peptococcaceae bacterium SCADC1_2_3]KFI37938.1 transposase [Peptococcaceae bacterium SCADC1_2_3]
MPRKARKKSESEIYHIIMRGINRQSIFEDEEDYVKFIQVIQKYKMQSGYKIYAYCLMGNHVHLLLKTGIEPLEQVMRRICGSYVYWYNWKYQRIGNLFQDRFKSEPVENESYFVIVQRYIHQNPLKARLVGSIEQYKWSSFKEYINKTKFVDADYLLKLFNNDREEAIKGFYQFNNEVNDDVCLDIEEKYRITDEEARNIIKKVCKVQNTPDLQKSDILKRNMYLKELKEEHGLSIRQIERLTGINRGIVLKA